MKHLLTATALSLLLAGCSSAVAPAAASKSSATPSAAVVTPSAYVAQGCDPVRCPTTTAPPAMSPDEYKASAVTLSYGVLSRDPSAQRGKEITFSGEVFQYDSNTGTSSMIVAVTNGGYGFYSDNVFLNVDSSQTANICKGTIVQFWGPVVGPYSYSTAMGGNLTIPQVDATYIVATAKGC